MHLSTYMLTNTGRVEKSSPLKLLRVQHRQKHTVQEMPATHRGKDMHRGERTMSHEKQDNSRQQETERKSDWKRLEKQI